MQDDRYGVTCDGYWAELMYKRVGDKFINAHHDHPVFYGRDLIRIILRYLAHEFEPVYRWRYGSCISRPIDGFRCSQCRKIWWPSDPDEQEQKWGYGYAERGVFLS
jgi:hypothetical protein